MEQPNPMADCGDVTREEALIRAAAAGDRDAFGELYRMFAPRVYAVACGLLLNREEALDVTQETFIRAWRALPRFRHGLPFFPWLYAIARNRCMSHLAKGARGQSVEFDDHVSGETDDEMRHVEMRRDIGRALATLSPDHREIILLRHFQDLSYEEIAQSLGCPIGTVMSRLHHARKALAAALAAWSDEQ